MKDQQLEETDESTHTMGYKRVGTQEEMTLEEQEARTKQLS